MQIPNVIRTDYSLLDINEDDGFVRIPPRCAGLTWL